MPSPSQVVRKVGGGGAGGELGSLMPPSADIGATSADVPNEPAAPVVAAGGKNPPMPAGMQGPCTPSFAQVAAGSVALFMSVTKTRGMRGSPPSISLFVELPGATMATWLPSA